MRREPRNEQETILLFSEYCKQLGFQIQSLRTKFPDATVLRLIDKQILEVEFEHKASNFIAHKHDPTKCDLIVCWWNDMKIPFSVPIFEIKTEIQYIPRPVDRRLKEKLENEHRELVAKHDRWVAFGWKLVFAMFVLSTVLRLINIWISRL